MVRRRGIVGLFVAVTMLLLGLTTLPALGDTVHKKDGRTVEGKIVSENDSEVVVQTKFGPVTISRADILSIDKGKTLVQQFKERWEAVDQEDVLDLLDLADWCTENRLSREAKKVYRQVVRIEPDNEAARKALGDVFHEGEWIAKSELARIEREKKAEERKAKEAARKGKSSSSGDGSSGASAGRTTEGLGDVSGPAAEFVKKISENEAEDKKLADELEGFFGQQFSVATSEHFSLRAQMPPPEVNEHVALAERLFVTCNMLFGLDPDHRLWRDQYLFFHVRQKGSFDDLIEWIDENVEELDAERKKFFKDGGGLIISMPRPISARLERDSPLGHSIAHWVGQTWIEWYSRGGSRPWLAEGFAAFTSVNEYGVNTVYCQTNTKYANRVEIADKNSDSAYKLVCFDIIDGALEDGYKHPWVELCKRSINQLDFADLAKSWSLVDFLMREHREQFREYILTVHQFQDEEQCLRKAFGWSGEELDNLWEAYVKANYSRTGTGQGGGK